MNNKVLIAYFSHEGEAYAGGKIVTLEIGNTRVAAQMMEKMMGADVFRIETVKPYPYSHMETVTIAQTEQREDARPELKGNNINVEDYDTIVLGYPNWWGTMPMAVFTFLESHDFFGKTILPFCTHEGSALGNSESDIAELIPDAELLKGLAVRGQTAQNRQDEAREAVTDWLREGGFIE